MLFEIKFPTQCCSMTIYNFFKVWLNKSIIKHFSRYSFYKYAFILDIVSKSIMKVSYIKKRVLKNLSSGNYDGDNMWLSLQ